MSIPTSARAVRLIAHGDPATSLVLQDLPLRLPSAGEIMLRMRCAPINPADLNVIEGTYGRLPNLPATAGNEGVGEVIAIGPQVTDLRLGDLVRPMDGAGTWCTHTVVQASACLPLPNDLPVDQAAMLSINPATAWGTLNEFTTLVPGDTVLVNAATSGVGQSFIALAKTKGLRIGALVRRAESIPGILAAGATVCVIDDREAPAILRRGLPPAQLALNQVGGDSAANLAKCLAPHGWMITVGAMGRQAFKLGNGPLIFNELHAVGFWVSRWYERAPRSRIQDMINACAELMRDGRLHLPIDQRFPLAQVHAAVTRAGEAGRGGKVLLEMGDATH